MIETLEQLIAAAEAHGLKLTPTSSTLDRSGLDFLVLHAKDEKDVLWIVRTPRHPKAYDGSVNEAHMLALVKNLLPVAVPEWCIHHRDIIAYPRLKGTPAWTYDAETGLTWNGINPQALSGIFVDSLARFCAALHKIPTEAVAKAGGRIKSTKDVRSQIEGAMVATRDILKPSKELWQRWQSWLTEDSYWTAPPVLVHGDLHPGHILLDDTTQVTGILDWTEAEVTDPVVDFTTFYGCFGREALATLIDKYRNYGGVPHPRIIDHIIERWAANAPLIADWGLKNANDAVIEHARGHLAAIEAEVKSE